MHTPFFSPLPLSSSVVPSKIYATNDPSLTYGTTGLVSGVTVDGVTLTDDLRVELVV